MLQFQNQQSEKQSHDFWKPEQSRTGRVMADSNLIAEREKDVMQAVVEDPYSSVRKIAQSVDATKSSIHRVLQRQK